MKVLSLATALSFGLAVAAAAQQGFGPLLTPVELDRRLSDTAPLVLDIRGDAYEAGHIPGAVHAPYSLFRGPSENPGRLVPEDDLEATLRSLGVTRERPVVVVHEGASDSDFGAAARVYWTLKSSGVSQLAILNGGAKAWRLAGLPMSTQVAEVVPSEFELTFSDDWLATTEDVAAIVGGEADALLLDARPQAFWEGNRSHAAAARPGTLPQSRYFEHAGWFSDGPAIVNADSARRLAEAEGLVGAETLVSFCNTGHWAATNWFALSELAGIDGVRLYPESMVGYSNAGHEMANTPGLFRNLMNQVRGIF
ncbi:sulfurtransferase [Rhodovulum sp. 12E13]|uniref:sulfurtransferase n=1 Tax=Rhodovulum sp. 12E13 TaxID=2203891 RepID=UPI000E1AD62A|nr:rhodanese-like domain-containing protein [Rhodovulum sp. 12E13]RDC71270.1 sulfurtransferase [Rhodovulum sp. 12E13]